MASKSRMRRLVDLPDETQQRIARGDFSTCVTIEHALEFYPDVVREALKKPVLSPIIDVSKKRKRKK